jgi:uncharacterized protein DUF4238
VAGEEPKQQHFVHRAYLEGFQDPEYLKKGEPALWVYIPRKSPFRQRPDRVARRNYYYCYREGEQRRFLVEHQLQKLEDVALPILRQLRERQFSLKPEDRINFAGYVALSHTRVPTFERSINRLSSLILAKHLELIIGNKNALEKVVTAIKEQTGEELDPEKFHKDLVGGTVVAKQTSREWSLLQTFKMMLFLQRVIYEMTWTFLLAAVDDPGFVTSDNPVSLLDPLAGPMRGIGFVSSPAAHFTFPISQNICLLAHHRKGPDSVKMSRLQVRMVNKATITHADCQVYAPFQSTKIQEILNDVTNNRKSTGRVLVSRGRVVEE